MMMISDDMDNCLIVKAVKTSCISIKGRIPLINLIFVTKPKFTFLVVQLMVHFLLFMLVSWNFEIFDNHIG